MGECLETFWLFDSVSGTDTTLTKEIEYKKEISAGTPFKIPVVIFSCAASVVLPREAKSGFKKKRARWGNPLQNYGFSLQLVILISRRPKKLNKKRAQWGNPLQNSGCYLQLRRLR